MYSDEVKDHFLNPRNFGEVKDPDAVGEAGNMKCGDIMKFSFKIDPDGRIEKIRFKCFGCAAAIANASMFTELAVGKTPAEAFTITDKSVADNLGGLPPIKFHCSVLAAETFAKAYKNFLENRGEPVPDEVKKAAHDHEDEVGAACAGTLGKEH